MSVTAAVLRASCPLIKACRFYYACKLPIIRFSRRTQTYVEKQKTLSHIEPKTAPKRTKLLITTRRRELNQATAEICGTWVQPKLVSRGWKHRKSQGDFFTIHRQRDQRVWPETEDTFYTLDLDLRVVSSLDVVNLKTPTWVQKEAIPILLRGKNLLCASETGSGKTLIYLLPIMHKLLYQEKPHSDNPASLILVPSKELANQVTSVASRIGSQLGLTVRCLGGEQGYKLLKKQIDFSVDILVSTPGILLKALKWDKISLTHLHYIVLDEADTLFDKTFSELVERILVNIPIAPHSKDVFGPEVKAQLVVIGATFPKKVGHILSKIMDLGSICVVKSKKLHYLMPHVQQTFKRLKGMDKVSELLDLLKKCAEKLDGSGVFIFCNNSRTVNWLGYILDDHGIKHARLHGRMPASMRLGIFESFQKCQTDVLVCTDFASRGIDSSRVGTVVNYDCPSCLEEYIHRAGRVGRVGSISQGNIVSFVTHPWDVELVQKIETAARKKISLPDMESNLKYPVTASSLIKESDG